MKLSSLFLVSLGSTISHNCLATMEFSNKISDEWDVHIGKKETETFVKRERFNGPVALLWMTTGHWFDDEYSVQMRDGDTKDILYRSGRHESNEDDISKKTKSSSGRYDVAIKCESGKTSHCDGKFSIVMVDCGCPPDKPIKLQDCNIKSTEKASPAVCRDFEISKEDVIGEWKSTSLFGRDAAFFLPHGTSTTDGKSATMEQAKFFTKKVSDGFDFKAVSGSVRVSSSHSSFVSKKVSRSISIIKEREVERSCPDNSRSSTGRWFVWQWNMEQEADRNGPGFSSKTSNFVCTESKRMEPRCPLGYCNDLLCQTCKAPFKRLSKEWKKGNKEERTNTGKVRRASSLHLSLRGSSNVHAAAPRTPDPAASGQAVAPEIAGQNLFQ